MLCSLLVTEFLFLFTLSKIDFAVWTIFSKFNEKNIYLQEPVFQKHCQLHVFPITNAACCAASLCSSPFHSCAAIKLTSLKRGKAEHQQLQSLNLHNFYGGNWFGWSVRVRQRGSLSFCRIQYQGLHDVFESPSVGWKLRYTSRYSYHSANQF